MNLQFSGKHVGGFRGFALGAPAPSAGIAQGWTFTPGQSITFTLKKTMALPAWKVSSASDLQTAFTPTGAPIVSLNPGGSSSGYTVSNFSSTPTSMTFTLTAKGAAHLSQTGLLSVVGGSGVTISVASLVPPPIFHPIVKTGGGSSAGASAGTASSSSSTSTSTTTVVAVVAGVSLAATAAYLALK